jgi:hypothetical protein
MDSADMSLDAVMRKLHEESLAMLGALDRLLATKLPPRGSEYDERRARLVREQPKNRYPDIS